MAEKTIIKKAQADLPKASENRNVSVINNKNMDIPRKKVLLPGNSQQYVKPIKIERKDTVRKDDNKKLEAIKSILKERQYKAEEQRENNKQTVINNENQTVKDMKFGINAHRAVIKDRDSIKIETKKTNSDSKSAVNNVKDANTIVESVIEKSAIDFICEPDGDDYSGDTSGIIVTMTSWPKRINNVEKTLKTILDNTVLPEKIIVNLATEEFPEKEANLPDGLVLLAQNNPIIEFHWLKHNTTVWKKIIPTIVRFKNANVICIDDDRLYPKDFIATFKEAADKNPKGPVTGAKISFYNKMETHCGHACLDKYEFYKDHLDFISKEVMDIKSSDAVLTLIAYKTGHDVTYLGKNYLSLIPQNNNPIFGYSQSNKINGSDAFRKADAMFDRYLNKSPKIALCGLAKNENLYIREWVEYYLKNGVDTIFLYDNNDVDGECFNEVINDYIESGQVIISDVRGIEKAFATATQKPLQESSYEDCYNKYKTKYDWFFFFDIDEFLCITNGSDFKTFLSLPKFNKVTTILVNWKNYGDSGHVRYENKPVMERFTTPGYDVKWLRSNTQCKTILRGGNKQLVSKHVHKLQIEGSVISNADGKILDTKRITALGANIDVKTYTSAYLKHYVTKTIEEYLIRYTGRGKTSNKVLNTIENFSIEEVVKNFFMINEKTSEKLNVIKEFKNGNMPNLKKHGDNRVIVSLTSYKPRMGTLHKVINSLLSNTIKPHKIVLTLYSGDKPYVTKELKNLEKDKKIEIIYTDDDLKPHKKYFYVMQKYTDIPIITVDDDVIYQNNLIELLYNAYLKNPNCVCCLRSRQITFANNEIKQYKYWPLLRLAYGPSQLILPTGVGGVIYPPKYLANYDMSDIKKFINTDDFYLYYLTIKNGMKIVQIPGLENLKYINGSQGVALYKNVNKINSENNNNDVAAKELIANRLINNGIIKV